MMFPAVAAYLLSSLNPTAENAVAYLNKSVVPGYNLIARPLEGDEGTVFDGVGGNHPPGAFILRWAGDGYAGNGFDGEGWDRPDELLPRGEGLFWFNPSTNRLAVTFVGRIVSESTVEIPEGFSILGAPAPRMGRITTDLGLKVSPFTQLYLYKTNRFQVFTYMGEAGWQPREPVLELADGFMLATDTPTNWVVELDVP